MSLEQLWLNQNQLEGTIPESIAQMENLSQLYVYENKLGGALPLAMSRFDKKNIRTKRNHGFVIGNDTDSVLDLHTLDLSDYELSGAVPAEICTLVNLKQLLLNKNRLGGCLPYEVGVMKAHGCRVDLSDNAGFTLSPDVSSVLGVTALDLSDCELRGEVPAAIVQLVNLKELDLSRNALTSLPASIGELRLKLKMAGNDSGEPPLRVATLGMGAIRDTRRLRTQQARKLREVYTGGEPARQLRGEDASPPATRPTKFEDRPRLSSRRCRVLPPADAPRRSEAPHLQARERSHIARSARRDTP